MKILGIVFCVAYVLFLLFGNMKVNEKTTNSLGMKAVGGLIFGALMSLFLGLPILGIIKLLN